MYDWNDLRYFLAVAEEGSTLKAAARLGANQTTVARRIGALEAALGHQLFERRRAGYRLTETGTRFLDLARPVRDAADALEAEADASSRTLSGTVRLSTNELYSEAMLTPLLIAYKKEHPDVRIELDHSHEPRDLASGEADIGLRVAEEMKGDALVARRIGEDRWTFYCSRGYAEAHGKPRTFREIPDHPVVGGGGAGIWDVYGRWLEQYAPGLEPVMTYDSSTGLLAAVRSGAGLAALPCMAVDDDPQLVRCFPSGGSVKRSVWLVTHERVRHTPHVRSVMDFLGDRLAERAKALGLA
ncbi:LysR family transcriptional regulator [Sphingomicrobium aestuariivivum]|uniref:LysR family transcriptional regulator n=1 Tax=Sphingomicrobium aestuariivivum TaxID=1582356 RepID=UPI001FD6B6BB|nr:LysR family transcriptional regulator [Sphingomicrobium aestuariivivum]MCJ8190291.1 LysR family transcriptional regulator [Sphingomicrobium aestuariivivum]